MDNKTPETAYATKVDSQGRPNIVVQPFLPTATVTAMQTRAATALQEAHGYTGAPTVNIKRGDS